MTMTSSPRCSAATQTTAGSTDNSAGGGGGAPTKRKRSATARAPSSSTDKVGGRTRFRETPAAEASSFTDGVGLATFDRAAGGRSNPGGDPAVVMPWLGFGTYRLGGGRQEAKDAVARALECGYRAIDTAFVYGGETTERAVGEAVRDALARGTLPSRDRVFITTKHWRKYHGYGPALQCLNLSLKRLGLDYVDLWLMHWPGPAYVTMHRRREVVEADPWRYAATDSAEMAALRAETWRAMEDAARRGLCRAIGVSNMTVAHLEMLKKTATTWPPAVNQVELQ